MWSDSPVSSNLRVEVCRFIPGFAAHSAVAFEADPHQIRSRNPAEYGSRRSSPGGFGNIGRGLGCASPSRVAGREIPSRFGAGTTDTDRSLKLMPASRAKWTQLLYNGRP